HVPLKLVIDLHLEVNPSAPGRKFRPAVCDMAMDKDFCRFYIPLRVSRDFCPDFGVLDKQFRSGQDIKVAEYAAICSPSSHLLAQRDGSFWRELIIDRNSDRIFTPCLDDVRGDG